MLDKKFLDILVCPICKGKLIYRIINNELICYNDRVGFPIYHNIPIILKSKSRNICDEEIFTFQDKRLI